ENKATEVFEESFETNWNPGTITGYLTLSERCPYNIQKKYFFISATNDLLTPIATSLHEIQHFYSHHILQPLFEKSNSIEKFNDFKEALTVVLNNQFELVLEKKDAGYSQHQKLRKWIFENYLQNKSILEICKDYIKV